MLEIKPIINAMLRSKVGAILLLIQIAITTAIVSNAAFIISDRLTYLKQDTGYQEQALFTFNVMTFGRDVNIDQQIELDEAMLRQIPGVIDASLMQTIPLSGSGSASGFGEKPEPEEGKRVRASYMFGDEHALNTLGVKLSEGRNFSDDEIVVHGSDGKQTAPSVVIASKAFADEMFPEGNGLGKTIYMEDKPVQIIGIVERMAGAWLRDSKPFNVLIIPLVKTDTIQDFVVRTAPGQRAQVMAQIEDKMQTLYDKRVVREIEGFDLLKSKYNAKDTLMLRMLVVLIVVLVLVTALGVFGLTLFNISKRTKQIGTRRALGARKSAIIRYFLVENALISASGLVIGSIAAYLLGQQLMKVFSLPALPLSFIVFTALSVLAMSLLSVLAPAKRAADISPSIATRSI
ncbi:ABC transporter permease [Pseudoalteromonas xiamenensis]